MKVQLKPGKICIGVSSGIMAIYWCTVLFKTVKHEYRNKSMSMSEAEFFELINMTYGEKRILEHIELLDGSYVNVCDVIRSKRGRVYVFRLAELTVGTHTTDLLETPEEFSQDHIDTVKWKIDKTYIAANSYMQSMIGSMIQIRGAVPLTRETHATILCIGLGGGAINSMLHHFFPQMDITVVEYDEQMLSMAKKWFGLELNERHQVKVDDGMKFVAKEAERGSSYDIIFLDACSGGVLYTDTLCPVSGFLDKTILEDIARLVGPHGILIINALSMKLLGDELEKFLMSKLLETFEFCTAQRPSASMNQLLRVGHNPHNQSECNPFYRSRNPFGTRWWKGRMGGDSSKLRSSTSVHEKLPAIRLPGSASYYEGMYKDCDPVNRVRNGSSSSRGGTKHPLSVKARRLITSCFANPHEMVGKRIMKRSCDLKDEFATFYTSLELEQREDLEDSIKILLKKVVTNIDFVDEVTRLSEEFGQRFVELRAQGFRADYFAILADATIKECTHLDSAVHKAHTTTQAFSQFGAMVFSSVRDGFYTEVRRIRRASNSFSIGSNSSTRRKKMSDGDAPRSAAGSPRLSISQRDCRRSASPESGDEGSTEDLGHDIFLKPPSNMLTARSY